MYLDILKESDASCFMNLSQLLAFEMIPEQPQQPVLTMEKGTAAVATVVTHTWYSLLKGLLAL